MGYDWVVGIGWISLGEVLITRGLKGRKEKKIRSPKERRSKWEVLHQREVGSSEAQGQPAHTDK